MNNTTAEEFGKMLAAKYDGDYKKANEHRKRWQDIAKALNANRMKTIAIVKSKNKIKRSPTKILQAIRAINRNIEKHDDMKASNPKLL